MSPSLTRKPGASLHPASLHPAPTKRTKPSSLKPTVQVFSRPTAAAFINHNYNLGRYPWDDHQDVVVNSVENAQPGQVAGVEHYRQLLSEREYVHVCTDPREYTSRGGGRGGKGVGVRVRGYDDNEGGEVGLMAEDEEDGEGEGDGGEAEEWDLDPRYDYSLPPTPPATQAAYQQLIYRATTANPAVFLAVIRLARRNLPFLDFASAINHLPNLAPAAKIPVLPPKEPFVEDVQCATRKGSVQMEVVFLPRFYQDGRHCLGYFNLAPLAPLSPTRQVTQTCLMTPCSTADLHKYRLIERMGGGNRAGGTRGVDRVGTRNGSWVSPDVVEEYESWRECWKVASSVWEGRMGLCRGGEEGED